MTEDLKPSERIHHGSIQEIFLNNARKNRSPIIVYLISGFQMRGVVKSFDNFVILLESEGKERKTEKSALKTRKNRTFI